MFLKDGFTCKLTIRARGHFPEMMVTYRLALPERVYEWRGAREAAKDQKARFRLDATFLCEHVLQWDAAAEIKVESIKHLAPFALTEILDAICGYSFDDQADGEKN